MSISKLGRTLVIANPAARNGRGAQGAEFVRRFLDTYEAATDGFEVRLTDGPGHATEMARAATSFSTVVALGGDGVIHEVVNGLMKIGPKLRPQLGIIPLGSGNDFARTLHVERDAPEASLGQLLKGRPRSLDLGLVNGTYYCQTLSFGLDAAIAIGTMSSRTEGGTHGARLYVNEGIRIFTQNLRDYAYHGTFDGTPVDGASVVFALQVGPTYGGGFEVCPSADPTDGLLDVCRSVRTPSVATTLSLFARARFGQHTGSDVLEFGRVQHAVLDFDEEPPCQADGEELAGTHFDVQSIPAALDVIVPVSFAHGVTS